jgi:hypothetical protein
VEEPGFKSRGEFESTGGRGGVDLVNLIEEAGFLNEGEVTHSRVAGEGGPSVAIESDEGHCGRGRGSLAGEAKDVGKP